jgi:hypothetical protein
MLSSPMLNSAITIAEVLFGGGSSSTLVSSATNFSCDYCSSPAANAELGKPITVPAIIVADASATITNIIVSTFYHRLISPYPDNI